MILTISGVDCSGKTQLARALAKYFSLQLWDTSFQPPNTTSFNWKDVVYGINLSIAQVYNSMDNFVRDRHGLDEYVYQKFCNRSGMDWRILDFAGIDKNILILVDLEYDQYLKNMSTRKDETPFIQTEFNIQRNLFLEAFSKTAIPRTIFLRNDSTFENMLDAAIINIKHLLQNDFDKVRTNILNCKLCNLHNECKSCNPSYNRPILPWTTSNLTKYLFVGLAPGRAKNDPFSNKCFTHSSGKFLKKALEELNIWDESGFCNICCCNTPSSKIIEQNDANICIHNNLIPLIKSLPYLKQIFILGNQADELFSRFRGNEDKSYMDLCLDAPMDKIIDYRKRIFHPSTFNYGYTEEKWNIWKKSITDTLNK
jgi:uracil-DNA glycosylase